MRREAVRLCRRPLQGKLLRTQPRSRSPPEVNGKADLGAGDPEEEEMPMAADRGERNEAGAGGEGAVPTSALALGLARRIAAFRVEDLTARALAQARMGLIDTIGCTLAGSVEP